MPYIKQSHRHYIANGGKPFNGGELNYCITKLVNGFLERAGMNYANINTVVGVLECAKLEIYRRVAAKYEDQKCAENGDVYS